MWQCSFLLVLATTLCLEWKNDLEWRSRVLATITTIYGRKSGFLNRYRHIWSPNRYVLFAHQPALTRIASFQGLFAESSPFTSLGKYGKKGKRSNMDTLCGMTLFRNKVGIDNSTIYRYDGQGQKLKEKLFLITYAQSRL